MKSIESEIKVRSNAFLDGIKNLSEGARTLWTAAVGNTFSTVIGAIGLLIPAIQSLRSAFTGDADAAGKQARVSSKEETDSTAIRQENRSVALESSIAGGQRRDRGQAIQEAEPEGLRDFLEQPRQHDGAIINRNTVGQPAEVTNPYREREALDRAVTAVKEGTTADLTRQLADAIAQRDAQTAAVLREAIALLKQSASQRVNDPRR